MMNALALDRRIACVPAMARYAMAALVLCGLILAMVVERASILRTGTEVRLATTPVDPRDLFRGDYVVLAYEISQIQPGKLDDKGLFKRGDEVYVLLKTGPDGRAHPSAVSRVPLAPPPGQVMLKGTVSNGSTCRPVAGQSRPCSDDERSIRVSYGLESYFVPQGQGLAIERTERSRVEVVAAVAPSGKSAIKRLLIDGKAVYDEPPY